MNSEKLREDTLLIKYIQLILIFVITILIFVLCYNKQYRLIALIPFAYMICNTIYNYQMYKKNIYRGGFICRIALIVIFIRYIVTSLSVALTGEFYYSGIPTSKHSINLAILLMIYELVCVYFTLYISLYYYSKRYKRTVINSVEPVNNKFVLMLFTLLGVVVILLVEPNIIMPSNFLVISKDYQKVKLDIAYDGLYFTLADLVKPTIFLILISTIKKKYEVNKKKIYILISFILVLFLMSMYTGTARFEILFAGIIGLYILKIIYGKIPKSFILGTIIVMLISFLSISLYKFSWMLQTSNSPIKDVIVKMFGMCQDYFSGPRAVANSIEMVNIYGKNIGFSTFINDFTGSIPVLSGFVNQSDRINVYYNIYNNILNNTLIIPMIGIGYAYFPLIPTIFTMVCYWFLVKIDYKLETCNSIEYKYLYLHLGLYLSMCQGFNSQIIFAKLLIPFLPLLFLFNLNKRICLKRKPRMENFTKKIKRSNVCGLWHLPS